MLDGVPYVVRCKNISRKYIQEKIPITYHPNTDTISRMTIVRLTLYFAITSLVNPYLENKINNSISVATLSVGQPDWNSVEAGTTF